MHCLCPCFDKLCSQIGAALASLLAHVGQSCQNYSTLAVWSAHDTLIVTAVVVTNNLHKTFVDHNVEHLFEIGQPFVLVAAVKSDLCHGLGHWATLLRVCAKNTVCLAPREFSRSKVPDKCDINIEHHERYVWISHPLEAA